MDFGHDTSFHFQNAKTLGIQIVDSVPISTLPYCIAKLVGRRPSVTVTVRTVLGRTPRPVTRYTRPQARSDRTERTRRAACRSFYRSNSLATSNLFRLLPHLFSLLRVNHSPPALALSTCISPRCTIWCRPPAPQSNLRNCSETIDRPRNPSPVGMIFNLGVVFWLRNPPSRTRPYLLLYSRRKSNIRSVLRDVQKANEGRIAATPTFGSGSFAGAHRTFARMERRVSHRRAEYCRSTFGLF